MVEGDMGVVEEAADTVAVAGVGKVGVDGEKDVR